MDSFESQLLDLTSDEEEEFEATSQVNRNPYAPNRTPEDQAVVDARKAGGLAPSGRKTSKATITDIDRKQILEPLAVFRAMTAEQLSILTAPKSFNLRTGAANLHNPKSVSNRLYRLRDAGLVDNSNIDAGRVLWGVTRRGLAAALDSGRIESTEQLNAQGVHGIDALSIRHLEAVNWVAAQAISPAAYPWKKNLKLPAIQLPIKYMRTEHQIMKDWSAVTRSLKVLSRENPDNRKIKFAEWRLKHIEIARSRASRGEIQWKHLTQWYPGLWTLARGPRQMDQEMHEHHLPDLVIDLENHRTSERRVSIAIEVELNAKRLNSYEKQFDLWRRELSYVADVDGASVYSKLIYFTNSKKVKERIEAVAQDLIDLKYLEIHPLTGRDGKSPLDLSNRT